MTADPTAPRYVYRIFDETGVLLYVGCTSDLRARMGGHASTQHWWPTAHHFTAEGPFDQLDGFRREKAVIASECPRYNRVHNPTPPPSLPRLWRELAADTARRFELSAAYVYRCILSGEFPADRPITDDEFNAWVTGMPSTRRGYQLYEAIQSRLIAERIESLPTERQTA